jgi:ParB-like chromosome segregation protein Spo0J
MDNQQWLNRIVGYGSEEPDQLLANPGNWRIHPKHQQDSFLGVVHDVGMVQNIMVNRVTGHVVDGHMRVLLAIKEGQRSIPITYVELSEEEEAEILATYDPIGAMAVADRDLFESLLKQFNTDSTDLQQMVSNLAAGNPLVNGSTNTDASPVEIPQQYMILIECSSEREQANLLERFMKDGLKCRALIS